MSKDFNAVILYKKALQCYDNRAYDEAIRYLDSALNIDNTDSDLYNLMGSCQLQLDHTEQAILNYEKAINIQHRVAYYMNLSDLYIKNGYYDYAILLLNKALKIQFSYSERIEWLHYNMGMAYLGLLDYSTALNSFKKILEISTKASNDEDAIFGNTNNCLKHALYQIGYIFYKMNNLDAAISCCQQSYQMGNLSALALINHINGET